MRFSIIQTLLSARPKKCISPIFAKNDGKVLVQTRSYVQTSLLAKWNKFFPIFAKTNENGVSQTSHVRFTRLRFRVSDATLQLVISHSIDFSWETKSSWTQLAFWLEKMKISWIITLLIISSQSFAQDVKLDEALKWVLGLEEPPIRLRYQELFIPLKFSC